MEQHPGRDSLEQQVIDLQQALQAARNEAQKYAQQRDAWQQKCTEALERAETLHQENIDLQHDYEKLRVQKGGFGFKMLFTNSFFAFVVGVVLCYGVLRLTDRRAHALGHFRQNHLFQLEYDLSHGNFDAAENTLQEQSALPENRPIHHEVEVMRQLVTAARKGCAAE